MPTLFYLAPEITRSDTRGPSTETVYHAKHTYRSGVVRAGSLRFGHAEEHIAFVEAPRSVLTSIRNDPLCFALTDEDTLDDPIGGKTRNEWRREFAARGWAAHHLVAGKTKRQTIASLASIALFSQRLEGEYGESWSKRSLRHKVNLDTDWNKLSETAQAEMALARRTLGIRLIGPSSKMRMREVLEVVADRFSEKTLAIGGVFLQPDHSYGGREAATASDTFDGAISGNWTNPTGPWNTASSTGMRHTTNGTIDNELNWRVNTMCWDADTFADDQWSQLDGDYQNSSSADVCVCVRSSLSTRAGYIGICAASDFEIREYSSGGTRTDITTGSTGHHTCQSGDTLTMEAEGTTIRLGSEDSGGGDTERISGTDATHTAGYAGVGGYGANSTENVKITGWSGGDMTASVPRRVTLFKPRIEGIRAY